MNIIVDLDGVICTEEKTFERALAKPIDGAAQRLAELSFLGHHIVIYTARSWSEERLTREWLKNNGIVYDTLVMGKPIGDVWVDDRAIKFESWDKTSALLNKDIGDDYNLYELRKITKDVVEKLMGRRDIIGPVLEIGPNNPESNVFKRMPDTYFNTRHLFLAQSLHNNHKEYISMDLDPAVKPDIVGDVTKLGAYFEHDSLGTIICNSVLEHVPNIDKISCQFYNALGRGGKVFMVSPWNIRLHGPRPDCRRISDDGFEAMFGELFDLKIEKRGGEPLNPIAFIVEMTKKV